MTPKQLPSLKRDEEIRAMKVKDEPLWNVEAGTSAEGSGVPCADIKPPLCDTCGGVIVKDENENDQNDADIGGKSPIEVPDMADSEDPLTGGQDNEVEQGIMIDDPGSEERPDGSLRRKLVQWTCRARHNDG